MGPSVVLSADSTGCAQGGAGVRPATAVPAAQE